MPSALAFVKLEARRRTDQLFRKDAAVLMAGPPEGKGGSAPPFARSAHLSPFQIAAELVRHYTWVGSMVFARVELNVAERLLAQRRKI